MCGFRVGRDGDTFDGYRRGAGARFHQRFPRSIFGAMIDEALKSIP